MSYKEADIVHENGRLWVLRDKKYHCYTVYETGITHSEADSAYRMNDNGLSIAKARCDYLAKQRKPS